MKRLFLAATACLLVAGAADASEVVAYLSQPVAQPARKVSNAADVKAYRVDAARHIYASYAPRIYKGRLPPLLHGIVVVETIVDADGNPRDVKLVRGPSHAPDVSAAVLEMVRLAGPLPAPTRFAGGLKFTEIWLVHKSGRFQLDALTEGQD